MTSESLQDHQPQTIRVLTFNILSTDHASWERRLQAARTGLQALRPDILALQESRRRPYLLTLRAGEMPLELGRRIDYIMIRSGIHGPTLAIADCRRVLDRRVAGIWASDHFGVVADLQVPTHPPGTWQDIEFH
jgi:endonuclease/exonuclease/phosphatase family metal-dependent hydrolase